MEKFLLTMAKIARDYTIFELNEELKTWGGYLKVPLSEAIEYLKNEADAKNINVSQRNANNDISFFVGEENGRRKDGYIMNIKS